MYTLNVVFANVSHKKIQENIIIKNNSASPLEIPTISSIENNIGVVNAKKLLLHNCNLPHYSEDEFEAKVKMLGNNELLENFYAKKQENSLDPLGRIVNEHNKGSGNMRNKGWYVSHDEIIKNLLLPQSNNESPINDDFTKFLPTLKIPLGKK